MTDPDVRRAAAASPFTTATTPDRGALVHEQIIWWFLTAVLGHELPPVPDAELQREADEFRRAHRLTRAADTVAWLEANAWTLDDFEQLMERRAALRALQSAVGAEGTEAFFEANRAAFDRAELADLVVADETLARSLAEALAGGDDFASLARRHSILPGAASSGGYLGWVPRAALKPGLAAAVFTGNPGSIVGPIVTDGGWHLLSLIALDRATLDEETRAQIHSARFTEWLAGQLVAVELLGGPVAPASNGATPLAAEGG